MICKTQNCSDHVNGLLLRVACLQRCQQVTMRVYLARYHCIALAMKYNVVKASPLRTHGGRFA